MEPSNSPNQDQAPATEPRRKWEPADSDAYLKRISGDNEFAQMMDLYPEIQPIAIKLLNQLKVLAEKGQPADLHIGVDEYFTDGGMFYWDWLIAARHHHSVDLFVQGWSEGKLTCKSCHSPTLHFELRQAGMGMSNGESGRREPLE